MGSGNNEEDKTSTTFENPRILSVGTVSGGAIDQDSTSFSVKPNEWILGSEIIDLSKIPSTSKINIGFTTFLSTREDKPSLYNRLFLGTTWDVVSSNPKSIFTSIVLQLVVEDADSGLLLGYSDLYNFTSKRIKSNTQSGPSV